MQPSRRKPAKQCMLNSLLIAALFLGTVGNTTVKAEKPVPDSLPNYESFFDTFLEAQMTADSIVGASVAVVQDGEQVFAKGYGFADLEHKVPVNADESLFFIGSDGKLFTWTAVMQLVEQEKLDLHEDINTYLDFEVPAAFGKAITLHHLMTHTAGFEDDLNSLMAAGKAGLLPLREHLIQHLPKQLFIPGTISAYSNYGTALAGYIVERVSGMPFEEYLERNILQPLDMQHSVVGNVFPSPQTADYAKGYKFQKGEYQAVDFEWTAAVPCAPLRTSVTDLSRFVQAHLNQGCVDGACILKKETLQQMHASQFTHPGQVGGMTYGFLDTRINKQRVLWHMGESPHFITILALIPEQNLGLIVIYNSPPVDGKSVLFAFMNTYFPAEFSAPDGMAILGWQTRAAVMNGIYIPARSAESTAQTALRLFQSAPVAMQEGRLSFSGWDFQESSAGVFQEVQGDRVLSFHQDEQGRRWLFIGPLAFFQIPWQESAGFILPLIVMLLLVILSTWIAWAAHIFQHRRSAARNVERAAYPVAVGWGLFFIYLMTGFTMVLLNYGETFVYAQETVRMLSIFAWLSLPWTLLILYCAGRVWYFKAWSLGWRLHYTLNAIAACASLWLLWSLNLIGGRL